MKIRQALVALAVAGLATSASAFEFHGYFRSGLGGSSKDGKQTCFYLPQLDHKFRLGNECETYGELDFQESLYKDKTGVEFKGEFMLAYRTAGDGSYESLAIPGTVVQTAWTDGTHASATYVATGNSNDIALRQAWVGAKLPQLGGASIWAGNRYYHRQDIHILDWYYWDPSGPGAGVEDVDLGFGKLAVAVFQSGSGNGAQALSLTQLGVYPNLADFSSSTSHGVQQRVFWRPDVRVYGIPFLGGGSLEAGVDLAIDSYNTQYYTVPGTAQRVGYMATVQHLQPSLLGGFNRFVFQYGNASLAPLSATPQANNTSDSYQWRFIDFLVVQPTPAFSAALVASYARVHQLFGGTGDFHSNTSYQLGARPVWHVNDYFKLQAEVGYQLVSPEDANADGVAGDRSLFKATLAPTLVAGGGFWSRPELRLFATYAAWSDAARLRNVTGGTYVGEYSNAGGAGVYTTGGYSNNGPFGAENSGFTFGAQVEAWW